MKHHQNIKKSAALYSISIIFFLSSLHVSLTSYFNSSFLSTFLDEKSVSLTYLIISFITILGLLLLNTVLRKIGNFRTSIILILIQAFLFYNLVNTDSRKETLIFFVLAMSMVSLIYFTFDIFLQKNTDSAHIGGIRGIVMTSTNSAWILGPLLGGMLIVAGNTMESYRGIYIAAFVLLFPTLYLVFKNFKNFKDSKYEKISIRQTVVRILKDSDISKLFLINIVLQTFYAWMIVYTPIYLYNVIGFNWTEISIILTIMLIPFVLVNIPLGKLADKKYGEKEIMAIGFTILGISTCAMSLFDVKNIFIWAGILFITRIGAASAEVMIETYFFKKVDGRDPEMLGLFRITRPLAYFIAPLITTIGLVYTTQPYLFVILGIICILTLYPILTIKDTN